MNTDRERLHYLLEKYATKSATNEETGELYNLLQHGWQDIDRSMDATHIDWEKMYHEVTGTPVIHRATVRKMTWYRMAAAAVIIILLGAGGYFLFFNKSSKTTIVTNTPVNIKAPQTNRAMITLANGDKVYLDSAGNGQLAMQDGVKLLKLADGQLAYNVGNPLTTHHSPLTFNTLSNPRGSKVIDMMLSDGTHVWLNAGSSVTYPVAFTGSERNVSITGEAYFEVAHNPAMPFKVKMITPSGVGGEVQVLGTHFNVNAYDDEADIKVTLLEGSVKVSVVSARPDDPVGRGQLSVLKPGEQAVLTHHSPLTTHPADVDEVMAWKNGYFQFSGNTIQTVMRQLSRWYDVDIKYEGTIPERQFAGQMQRTAELSGILKILEESNVHFRVEERTITVMP